MGCRRDTWRLSIDELVARPWCPGYLEELEMRGFRLVAPGLAASTGALRLLAEAGIRAEAGALRADCVSVYARPGKPVVIREEDAELIAALIMGLRAVLCGE